MNYRKRNKNIKNLLIRLYPKKITNILKLIGRTCEQLNCKSYLVGGPVRDLLLRKSNQDLDVLIEYGNIKKIISQLNKGLNKQGSVRSKRNKIKFYDKFNTATIYLDNMHIDFATARSETYNYPGALPEVEISNLESDLARRDFTINTLAVCLNPDGFGIIIDLHNGYNDLKKSTLRVLHDRSFIDDPTRIFRASRFVTRFGLEPDRRTGILLKRAIVSGCISSVSKERIREEFIAILSEQKVLECLKLLSKWNILRYVDPKIKLDKTINNLLKYDTSKNIQIAVKMAILLYRFSLTEVESILHNIKFSRTISNEIYDVIRFMSGDRIKKLPAWADDFYNIIGFERKRDLLNGDDLIRLGFKPGPLFKQIFSDLFLHKKLKTHKQAIEFITRKYRDRISALNN